METYDPKKPLNVWLSIIGGIGLTLMMIAMGVGVVQGATTNSNILGAVFWTGLIMLIGATIGWFGVSQPYKYIDDINQPQYTGHHHHDDEH